MLVREFYVGQPHTLVFHSFYIILHYYLLQMSLLYSLSSLMMLVMLMMDMSLQMTITVMYWKTFTLEVYHFLLSLLCLIDSS